MIFPLSDAIDKSKQYRIKILEMTYKAKGGHIGGSFSVIDILNILYNYTIKHDYKQPHWDKRDRVIFSKGHCCLALYVVLNDNKYLNELDLTNYSTNGALLGGHPKKNIKKGIEISTGSLGHGLSVAVGIAKSLQMDNKKNRVFCIVGDGELNEGSCWEAIMLAAQWKLDNLTLIVDNNNQISLDSLDNILSISPLDKKLEAFNWNVSSIDGHDLSFLYKHINEKNLSQKPKVVIANTVKGKGVDFMEKVPMWHYKGPSETEYKRALHQLQG